MDYPQNQYPNYENYPVPSFPQEVQAPLVDPDTDMKCVRYNPAWSLVLMSACNQLLQLSSWIGTDEEKKQAVNRATNLKIQLQMFEDCDMGCCYDVVLHRVNPDTGQLEISTDDGLTWQSDPDNPASLVLQMPPPVTAGVSDTKCDAAANGQAHLIDIIEHDSSTLGADASLIEIATIIAAYIVTVMVTVGTALSFLPIILGTVAALVTLGQAAFDAYWTSDERGKLLCALYCNIGDDGSFDDVGYAAVISYLRDNLTAGVPADMIIGEIKGMGREGLNNLCAYGTATGTDCSDCVCGDVCPDFASFAVAYRGTVIGTPTAHKVTVESTTVGSDDVIIFTSHAAALLSSTNYSDLCCVIYIKLISGTENASMRTIVCGGNYNANLAVEGTTQDGVSPTNEDYWFQLSGNAGHFTVEFTDYPNP